MNKQINNKILSPVKTKTLAEEVEIKLIEYLRENNFQPGNPIPGELELAEILEVSRNVVREALSRLKMVGLVESKKRRGMQMAIPDIFSSMQRSLDPSFLDKETIKEIFQFRLVLEMGLPNLLYANKENIDFEKLEKLAEKYEKAKSSKVRIECDREFHGTLYEATKNDTLIRFRNLLTPLLEFQSKSDTQNKTFLSHSELVKILKDDDITTFRKAMELHLKTQFDLLK